MTREEKNAYQREWVKRNKDKKKIQDKKYREANREKIREIHRKWREKNREHIREKARENYYKNPQAQKERQDRYRASHKEEEKQRMHNYKINNREKVSAYERKRRKEPLYRLKVNIRTLIKNSIKYKGHRKNTKTEQILGCTLEEFITYLQSKFQEGMTLENHRTMAYRPYNTYI